MESIIQTATVVISRECGCRRNLRTGMFGDLELHHATGQYLGRHASQLPSRLHQPQKPVDEEEEDSTHSLGRMVLPHMPRIECKQEDIKLVHAQEYIEELLPNWLHGGGPHHQRHHSCNNTRCVWYTRVFPFTHLPQTQINHQNDYTRLNYPLDLMTSAGLIVPQMWVKSSGHTQKTKSSGVLPSTYKGDFGSWSWTLETEWLPRSISISARTYMVE